MSQLLDQAESGKVFISMKMLKIKSSQMAGVNDALS